MKFTFNSYKNLIGLIKSKGYNITNYHNHVEIAYPCILRHDVDYDLEKASLFAEFEKKELEGVSSTYFILLSSELYNICTKRSGIYLKKILDNGHEIGLHFDEKKYEDILPEEIKNVILYEADLLSNVIGKEVTAISMHRPSKRILEQNISFEKMVNSYSNTFFKKFKYVSDSHMNWRENVEEVVGVGTFEALHILTHPVWYGQEEQSITPILASLLEKRKKINYMALDENFSDLQSYIPKEQYF